jgi:uncharacterized integral membrane protein
MVGAIASILLGVFNLADTKGVEINYFGAAGRIPLGIALLLAAVGGALPIALAGATRVLQPRRRIKHPRG